MGVLCCAHRGSVAAAGVRLQAFVLECPGASSCEDRDPRAASGQTECPRLGVVGTHTVRVYLYSSRIYLHPDQTGRRTR